jgi:hypothetical protein
MNVRKPLIHLVVHATRGANWRLIEAATLPGEDTAALCPVQTVDITRRVVLEAVAKVALQAASPSRPFLVHLSCSRSDSRRSRRMAMNEPGRLSLMDTTRTRALMMIGASTRGGRKASIRSTTFGQILQACMVLSHRPQVHDKLS